MPCPILLLALQAAVHQAGALNPHASELFERDPVLREWAVRRFDTNRDGWLTLYEAQPALAAFKDIADGDRDGRITTWEYARGKEFVAARR
jgi:hypothetical protein